jgi:two-component system, OmpR family, sensor histidine kinase KdpD
MHMRWSRRGLRSLLSVAGVGMITWVAYSIIPVNATTVGFAYLLLVLLIASTWGFSEAALASVASTAVFNFFFFDPKLTFTIADPQNWVALFSFLATALIASRLSIKAKRRALDAIERQKDLERLYTFSRAILLINSTDPNEPFANQLAKKLADAFALEAVVLYEPQSGQTYRAGPSDLQGIDSELRNAALTGTESADPERNCVVTAVRLGSNPIASLALKDRRMSDSVLQSVANLVAIGLERAKAQDLAHQVEVTKRSERLRTTLIDAMAHEFKTPLTSIRAVTSALLANSNQNPASSQQMLKIADEEAERLEELIDNTLDVAQLDSDHIDVDWEISDFNDVVREVVLSMKTEIGDHQLEVVCDDQLPPISMDRRLITLAIKQLVNNALKYSSSKKPVTLHTFVDNRTVGLEIINQGKAIPEEEQKQIFERFYRSPSVRDQIPGSGLGLSIAFRILHAHGGDLTVKSRPDETTFRLVLPIEHKGGTG